jgi:hypothetical protein
MDYYRQIRLEPDKTVDDEGYEYEEGEIPAGTDLAEAKEAGD